MHTTALATCLVLGSIQTIGLASACISTYNLGKDAEVENPAPQSIKDVHVPSGPILSTPKNSTMITFLVLSIIGVLFGLMVLSNPSHYESESWKIVISAVTYIWLAVTLTTTILAMTIYEEILPSALASDSKGINKLPLHFRSGIITSYVFVSILLLIAIYYTFFE